MSIIDELLKKADLDKVTKEVEAMRADLAERTDKLKQAEKLLKILNGTPLRKARKPRAKKGETAPPPQLTEEATSARDQVAACLKEVGKPMSAASISREIDLPFPQVDLLLKKNPDLFRPVGGGTYTLVK